MAAVALARQSHRRRAVLGRGRDAQRSGLPLPRDRSGDQGRARTTINLPDTVGYSTPDEIGDFFRDDHRRACRTPTRSIFSAHCHDDLGLAVANTLAAIGAGARQVECTINGIGERAGNASLEEIVMAIARARRSPAVSRPASTRSEIYAVEPAADARSPAKRVQANKAIVGRNAFAHEAGIHQDGMLKDRRTYEIMRPEDVGVPRDAGARQALGPARRAAPLRADRATRWTRQSSTRSTGNDRARRPREGRQRRRPCRDRRARERRRRRRTNRRRPRRSQDFSSTPAELGYGHGV